MAMKRRIVLLFALVLFLGCQALPGSAAAAADTPVNRPVNPFALADGVRQQSLLTMGQAGDGAFARTTAGEAADRMQEKSDHAAAVQEDKAQGRTFLVQFNQDVSLQAMADILQTENYNLIGSSENRLVRLTTTDITAFEESAAALIAYVEEDRVYRLDMAANDTFYSQQWGLAAINAPAAWDITTGNPVGTADPVYVAVIDSGIDRYHPDLDEADIRNGWDYILGQSVSRDTRGHGTNVTGIIAAETNNAQGIAGVCWDIAIIPLLVVYPGGTIYVSDVVAAIYDAADMGCKVINLSLGGPDPSDTLQEAVQYAVGKGCIVVAAAGNDGYSIYNYPASYDPVISVGSIDSSFTWSSFSTYNDKVDVCAPGEGVITTHDSAYAPGSDYVIASGTSFSAPHVAGIAALAACVNRSLTTGQFMDLIISTSLDLGVPGYDPKYGHGLIDAGRLLTDLRAGSTYTVTFDSQGGTAVAGISVGYDSLITAPPDPARTGYAFDGWYKEAACTHGWDFAADRVTEDITLYAKWIAATLPAPSFITAAWDLSHRINITWGLVPGATGYEVYRAVSGEGTYRRVGALAGGTTGSFTDEDIALGTAYDYKVRAIATDGSTTAYGGWSDIVSASCVPVITSDLLDIDRDDHTVFVNNIAQTRSSFLAQFTDSQHLVLYAGNDTVYAGNVIMTGQKVKLITGGVVWDELTVIVKGDANGDGLLSIADYTVARLHILRMNNLTGVYLMAADVDGNGAVTIADYTQMRLHILKIKDLYE